MPAPWRKVNSVAAYIYRRDVDSSRTVCVLKLYLIGRDTPRFRFAALHTACHESVRDAYLRMRFFSFPLQKPRPRATSSPPAQIISLISIVSQSLFLAVRESKQTLKKRKKKRKTVAKTCSVHGVDGRDRVHALKHACTHTHAWAQITWKRGRLCNWWPCRIPGLAPGARPAVHGVHGVDTDDRCWRGLSRSRWRTLF